MEPEGYLEIEHTLVAGMCNLSPRTRQWLWNLFAGSGKHAVIIHDELVIERVGVDGYRVMVGTPVTVGMAKRYPELVEAIQLAQTHNCEWVRYAWSAEATPGLPVFDREEEQAA
jgi:hypothetical protein